MADFTSPYLLASDAVAVPKDTMVYIEGLLLAYSMFISWLVLLTLASTLLWLRLRSSGFVYNRRTAIIAVLPFVGASLKVIPRIGRPTLFVAIVGALASKQTGAIPLPASGSWAQLVGEIVFCIAFALFAGVYVPREYGASALDSLQEIEGGETPSAYAKGAVIRSLRFNGVLFVGSMIAVYRGPYCTAAVILILAYAVAVTVMTLREKALIRFSEAPRLATQPGKSGGFLAFVHVSDVHVTCQKNGIPTGGGRSGLEELRQLAAHIQKDILTPRLVAVSGDLVDRGDAEEWDLAMEPLRKIKDSGVDVVLSPGNHDILPSYSPSRLHWASIRPGLSYGAIDGQQVRRYLDAALELAPTIATWDGVPLKQYLESFDSPWQKLSAMWDKSREQAAAAVGLPLDTSHPKALKKYRQVYRDKAQALENSFVAAARKFYPTIEAEYWQRHLYILSPSSIAELFQHDPWNAKWYDPYPLRIAPKNPETDFEILIANSTPRDPLLIQSSLGVTGKEQIDRLELAIRASENPRILILHHHTFVRWADDEYNFARWGTLSHDGRESRRLYDLLRENASDKRDIAVLTGHTHSLPRVGPLTAPNGDSIRVLYFESAALGDPKGCELLTGHLDDRGRLQSGYVNLANARSTTSALSHQ
jgi:3',5'-cyclic AMP phosphodiesterase CpdA